MVDRELLFDGRSVYHSTVPLLLHRREVSLSEKTERSSLNARKIRRSVCRVNDCNVVIHE